MALQPEDAPMVASTADLTAFAGNNAPLTDSPLANSSQNSNAQPIKYVFA
jgi:hypothetical protein